MRRLLFFEKPKTDKGSLAVSIAANIVFIALIGSITFTYDFGALLHHVPVQSEHVQFVTVQPKPVAQVGNGTNTKVKPKKAIVPAPILAPTTIPTALPPITPPTASMGAVNGTGTGTGGAPTGVASGVEPTLPDPRLELRPGTFRVPLSNYEKNDSAIKAIFSDYRQAEIAAEEGRGRSPRDWTMERNGQKYGLDSQYIYLGKFKIPSAILAALPFNTGGVDGHRLIENRNADWIRNDIYTHSQGLSEDDFRAAVRRIRERKDREKKEAEEKAKAQQPATPIVP